MRAGFLSTAGAALLDLPFGVRHMFAYHWVVLFAFELFGIVALVLGGRIEVTGAGAGNEFDFLLHI